MESKVIYIISRLIVHIAQVPYFKIFAMLVGENKLPFNLIVHSFFISKTEHSFVFFQYLHFCSCPLSIFLSDNLSNTVIFFRWVVLNPGMLESPGRLFKQRKNKSEGGKRGEGRMTREGRKKAERLHPRVNIWWRLRFNIF